MVYGRGMLWGYPNGHYFNAENVFNDYINGVVSSWNNWYTRLTLLRGDGGLTTASETAGTKYLTMGHMMFQYPHVVPATVGGDALTRMERAGSITTGVYWEIATQANGKFKIGKEASTNKGLNLTPSGNVGIRMYSTSYKLDVNRTLNATSISDNGILLTTTLPAKENALTFSAPFIRTTYTIRLDLSSYDTTELRSTVLTTSATASTTNATITNVYVRENALRFSAPLTRTTNTISVELSGYAIYT